MLSIKRRLPLSPTSSLALISLGFAALVVVFVGVDRFIGYDEGLYLLEAQDLGESHRWGKHRALGIPLLLVPILSFVDSSYVALRYWFVVLNGLLLFVAFRPWQDLVGSVATYAAALLSISWLGLVYGPTALPNLPAGLAAVGVLGAFLSRIERGSGRLLSILGLGFFLAVVRPTATVALLLVAIGVVLDTWWRERADGLLDDPKVGPANPWSHFIPLVLAFLAGGVIWVLDSLRLDGPVDRVRTIVSFTGGVDGQYFEQFYNYVARFDSVTKSGSISGLDVTLGVLLGVGVMVSFLARDLSLTRRRSALAALTLALMFFATYLTHDFIDVRLLLPAWCALAIPVSVGYHKIFTSGSTINRWLGIGLLVVVVGWSIITASRVADEYDLRADNFQEMAEYLRVDSAGSQCRFAIARATTQIEIASGCLGVTVIDPGPVPPADLRLDPDDLSTVRYAVYWGDPGIGTFFDSWSYREVDTGTITWRVYKEPPRGR